MLTEAGFTRLSERDEWALKPGGRYFFTRNMSSIVAFAVGEKYEPGNGFNIIGAHTDSPCPKLKPVSAVKKGGFLGVGVQTYGGGLWHTWFDRDLSVAGRVLLRKALITPDDYANYQQICPLFEPVYVFYDEKKEFYQELADVQREILAGP